MIKSIFWSGMLGLLAFSSPVCANLITNGDFATNLNGWTTGGAGCAGTINFSSAGNPGGSVILNGCGESTLDPFVSQSISGLSVGATYIVTWDMALHVNIGGGTGKSFGVFLDSEPNNPLRLTEFLDNSWHTVQTSFVATNTTQSVIFAAELDGRTPGGPGTATDVSYLLDNVSVNAVATTVPEPAAFGLAFAGLAALLVLSRLRSR